MLVQVLILLLDSALSLSAWSLGFYDTCSYHMGIKDCSVFTYPLVRFLGDMSLANIAWTEAAVTLVVHVISCKMGVWESWGPLHPLHGATE